MSQLVLAHEGQVIIPVQPYGLGVLAKLNAQATGGSCSIIEHDLPPHTLAAPLHTHHNEDEVSFILQGQVTVMLGDVVSTAPAGAWVFKPRKQAHTFWNATDEMARILEIIAPGGFENYFGELVTLFQTPAPPAPEAIAALAQKYGMEMDFASIPVLLEKYQLGMGAPPTN